MMSGASQERADKPCNPTQIPRDDGPADTLFIDRRSVIPHPAV